MFQQLTAHAGGLHQAHNRGTGGNMLTDGLRHWWDVKKKKIATANKA